MDAESFLAVLGSARPRRFLVLSLQGPHSTYVSGVNDPEMKRGFHWGVSPRAEDNRLVHGRAVAAALAWAADNGGDRSRAVLAGFSQPCSFNYRLAAEPKDGVAFPAVLAFCGGVPGEWIGAGRADRRLGRDRRAARLDERRPLLPRGAHRSLPRDPRVAVPDRRAPPLRRRPQRAVGVLGAVRKFLEAHA